MRRSLPLLVLLSSCEPPPPPTAPPGPAVPTGPLPDPLSLQAVDLAMTIDPLSLIHI